MTSLLPRRHISHEFIGGNKPWSSLLCSLTIWLKSLLVNVCLLAAKVSSPRKDMINHIHTVCGRLWLLVRLAIHSPHVVLTTSMHDPSISHYTYHLQLIRLMIHSLPSRDF